MVKEPTKLYGETRPAKSKQKEITGFSRLNLGKWFVDRLSGFFPSKKSSKAKQSTESKETGRKSSPRKRGKRRTIGSIIFRTFLILGVWISAFVLLAILWFSYDLPDVNQLESTARKPSVTIQAQDGTVIGTYGDLYEDVVKVSELPPYVPQALMSIEDRRFYSHFGVDVIGLLRAAYTNYKANRIVQGGSTITQQLAKNFLQSHGKYDVRDRSLRRKIQEVILSIWLEWKFTKEQIMTMYLNRVYFGSATFGIEAASRKYFNKSARDLTVYEAAAIAGLLKAPSRYSPTGNPQRSRERTTLVLIQMAEAGYIRSAEEYLTQHDAQVLADDPVDLKGAHFFADWVYEQVPSLIGAYDQDLVVMTTFDSKIQRHADEATKKSMETMAKEFNTTQIALVAMSPQGAVRAMIGGMNYGKSQYNRVTQMARQPGSTFKPFVYLAGLEAGFSPNSLFSDAPVSIGNWRPGNFRKYTSRGELTMQQALAQSVNTVTVRIAAHVGPRRVVRVARRLGITSDMLADWSICLGAMEVTLLELTGTFATFANNGNSVSPYGILEIRNRSGDILYRYQNSEEIQVIKPKQLGQMNQMLKAVVDGGTGRAAKLSCPVGGKSGSNADKDAWFIGFTKDLVAGIWTGNDNNAPMHKDSTGGRLPARTFAAFMKPIVGDEPPADSFITELSEENNEEGDLEGAREFANSVMGTEEEPVGEIVDMGNEVTDEILADITNEPATADQAQDNTAFEALVDKATYDD